MRTSRAKIKGELRRLFVQSVERAEAIKRDKYSCCNCNKKQSVKKGFECKVQVHHLDSIDWDAIIDLITSQLLCDSSRLQTLCVECHDNVTYNRSV